jgi:cytoskeleton protein RodZ
VTEEIAGPGQLLRAEREALGVTVREVAETLNLSTTVIQALEGDQYERLPGVVFARGYIRAYARLLELDPQPLLALYPGQTNGVSVQPVMPEPGLAEWIRRRPAVVLSVLGLILVAALGAIAVLLWPEQGLQSLWRGGEPETVIVPPRNASDDWGWDMDLETDSPEDPPAAVAPEATGSDPEAGRETAMPAAAGPGQTVSPIEGVLAEDAGGQPVRRITEAGDQRLNLVFSADCWVEIRSPGGRVLYSNLNQAGTELQLVGEGPFRIQLGYAPGVTLVFEGESVALGPHTRNNVASLVLGQ